MRFSPRSRLYRVARSSAFSLVELLAVIAIVGVLAVVIVAVLGNARQRAQASACASNLRQIGSAMMLHAAGNNGYLPAPRGPGGDWYNDVWMTALQPYLENKPAPKIDDLEGKLNAIYGGVFHCPGKKNYNFDGPTDKQRLSYGMNCFSPGSLTGVPKARKLNLFTRPAITALVVDSNTGSVFILNPAYMYRDYTALWHGGSDNVLFADGHVQVVPKDGLSYGLMLTDDDEARAF